MIDIVQDAPDPVELLAQHADPGEYHMCVKYDPQKEGDYEKSMEALLRHATVYAESHVFIEPRLPNPKSVSFVSITRYPDIGGVILRRVEMWHCIEDKIIGRLDFIAREK